MLLLAWGFPALWEFPMLFLFFVLAWAGACSELKDRRKPARLQRYGSALIELILSKHFPQHPSAETSKLIKMKCLDPGGPTSTPLKRPRSSKLTLPSTKNFTKRVLLWESS